MQHQKIYIVGIGDDGLDGVTSAAREVIQTADLIVGAESTLRSLPKLNAELLLTGGNLEQIVERIESSRSQKNVVLASGDPLFYGIARFLCDRLGKHRFEVFPHVSSMQLAFARVKESWEDAYLTNLANHRFQHVIEKIRVADTVGLFTTEADTPSQIAKALLQHRIDYFSAYVCENLGSPDERVTQGTLQEIAGLEFSPLNVMILVRCPSTPDHPSNREQLRIFGNPDEAFLQSRPKQGLLTPSEVRVIALAQLSLTAKSVVWDVGAGSGSVAIEAARIAADGKVYAIEMDPQDHELIAANAQRFQVKNLERILGQAPEAWEGLPAPDAIFIGGSGREISTLVAPALDKLKPGGALVVNVGSIENLAAIHEILQKQITDVRVWMLNVARGIYQLERVRFDALNPTFLLAVDKPKS